MTLRKPDPAVQWRWRIRRALGSRRITAVDVCVIAVLAALLMGRVWLVEPQPSVRYPPPVADLIELVRHPYDDLPTALRAVLRTGKAVEALGPHEDVAVAALIDVLKSDPGLVAQVLAVSALRHIGPSAAPAVPWLVPLVEDGTVKLALRSMTINALEAIGPGAAATAVPLLVEIAGDPGADIGLRKESASALGAMGRSARSAVPALAAALAHEDAQLRINAAKALQGIGPSSAAAVPSLAKALGDKNWLVSSSAANALGAIGPAAEEAVPALARLLLSSDVGSSDTLKPVEEFMPTLEKVLPPRELRTLEKMLDANNSGVGHRLARSAAASALASIGPGARPAVPALNVALRDPSPEIRIVAARTLGALGAAASGGVRPLTAALGDEDSRVRQAAQDALKKIRGAAR